MKFVLIPAGSFMMGSGIDDDEKPVHKVVIKEPFYMQTTEVTQRQYYRVTNKAGKRYTDKDKLPSSFNPKRLGYGSDKNPVERVSYYDVMAFIDVLNELEGSDKYALPTEAQWEYAARAGTSTRWHFGDDWSKLPGYAWYDQNSGEATHRVASRRSNPWGLYDMYGNVWEWVQDDYAENYNNTPRDGSAHYGDGKYKVLRGSSWYNEAIYTRSANRYKETLDARYNSLGFRLIRKP